MARGSDDSNPEDEEILSADDLDISDDEHVTELEEGRYVVSSDARTGQNVATETTEPEQTVPDERPGRESGQSYDDANVHEWLASQMADSNSRYGIDVTAKLDAEVDQQRVASNDIVTAFESFMLWYGRQMDGSTPVADVFGILFSESNVPVKHPPESFRRMVESTGVSPDDTVADLIRAVEDQGGAEF